MEARNLSLNDVVTSVNNSNLILPAGDVRIAQRIQYLCEQPVP